MEILKGEAELLENRLQSARLELVFGIPEYRSVIAEVEKTMATFAPLSQDLDRYPASAAQPADLADELGAFHQAQYRTNLSGVSTSARRRRATRRLVHSRMRAELSL